MGSISSARPDVPTGTEPGPLDERSKALRREAVRILRGGKRGHVGSTFSLIEICRVLYDDILSFRPDEPRWADRDRCILSKGHGCIALYVMLADKGFISKNELDKFCHHDGILGGHPDHIKVPGVEASTGSLGHGPSFGVGMALAARARGKKHRVFVILGDGECNEGSVWEAAMCAGKHKLPSLTFIVDYNKRQSYASTFEVQDLEPFADKWRAFGFDVREVNGHDVEALRANLRRLPFSPNMPNVLICHTVKGKGIAAAEGNNDWHHLNKIPPEKADEMLAAIDEY